MRFHTVTLLQEHINLFTSYLFNNSDSELTCCGFSFFAVGRELLCSQSFKTPVLLILLDSRGTDKESSSA